MRGIVRAGLIVGATAGSVLAGGKPAGDPVYPDRPPHAHYPITSFPGSVGPAPQGFHHRDPGPGVGWSYYGLPGGPYTGYHGYNLKSAPPYPFYYFGFPAAYGNNWSNGLPLYGPPVPTYGPVPGAFGGATNDKLFFRNPLPNGPFFYGLGYLGVRTPLPRPRYPSVSVWPPVVGDPAIFAGPMPPAADPTCVRMAVKLPEPAAEVWVDQKPTTLVGAERIFESPPLAGAEPVKYDLVARWLANGEPRAESREVTARPGQLVVVDFTRPAEQKQAAADPGR